MEDNKKPGQRDISDLKARLGLKKTAAMPAAAPQPAAPAAGAPAQPQAVPQPMPAQGSGPTARPAVPSPFGPPPQQQQPAPQAAPPPDPRRDPFAQQQAANLAAFYGVGQVLPGSGDSVDATPIAKPKAWGRIGLVAGIAALTFGVGNACGRIYNSRTEFNRTIDQAGDIKAEIDTMAKQLNLVVDKINGSKPTLSGGVDLQMTEELGNMDLKKPDTQKLFHTNYMHLEDIAIDRLFNYYNHTILLYDLITQHSKRTENDKDAINRATASAAAHGGGEKNYGVILQAQGGLQVADFVELGTPTCPTAGQTDCQPNEWKGFKYRVDSGGAWGERPLKGAINSIVMPLHKTPLFNTVAAGNPDILALRDYAGRVAAIRSLIATLNAEQKEVVADMTRAAGRPKVFTF